MLLSEYQALKTTAVDHICSPLVNSAKFPRWLTGKEIDCQSEDSGLILGQDDPLEKGMATHSSIPVWEIPWTEEPGGLQSMGLQKSWTGLSS